MTVVPSALVPFPTEEVEPGVDLGVDQNVLARLGFQPLVNFRQRHPMHYNVLMFNAAPFASPFETFCAEQGYHLRSQSAGSRSGRKCINRVRQVTGLFE